MAFATSCLVAVAGAPTFPPLGWALVEARCEKSAELTGGRRTASFLIDQASAVACVGKRFEVAYFDASLPWFSKRSSDLYLSHFAPDDLAYFWVFMSGDRVTPITDLESLVRVSPRFEYFMVPVRERPARRRDEGIIANHDLLVGFGWEATQIIRELDVGKRVSLLQKATESENRQLAAWAKWVVARYYPPQFARSFGPADFLALLGPGLNFASWVANCLGTIRTMVSIQVMSRSEAPNSNSASQTTPIPKDSKN